MFNETRLLDKVAYGSQFGQEFKTRIVNLNSGHERRNVDWAMPLGRYSISYDALIPEHHTEVRAAHMASMGSAIAFRFKDWTDYKATNEVIGEGEDGAMELQLTKAYTFGPISLQRIIRKPVVGTVSVFENGVAVPATVDYTRGTVSFISTVEGSTITWSGEFDIPVRFEQDRLDVDPITKVGDNFLLVADVDLIEVRDV